MFLNGINPKVLFGRKAAYLKIVLTFQKQLKKPLFRGDLGLSNGISPS
jgi:hypothetical protein